MKLKGNDRTILTVVLLGVVLLLTACSSSEEQEVVEQPVQVVTTRLNFSLPSRIVGKRNKPFTRMGGDIVQANGTDEEFRGIDDVHMLCFGQYPTKYTQKMGAIISMNANEAEMEDGVVTEEDRSLAQEIEIPVGTSYFAFYARSADYPRNHEERMKYGIIETVGLSKASYDGNSGIRFRPVPICNTSDKLGNSAVGSRLLNLLNNIVGMTGPEEAPNDKMSTAGNLYLNEAWKQLKELRVLSSQSVEIVLGYLNKLLTQEFPDDQGRQLADAILAKIADCCETPPEPDNDQLTLKPEYQGYPADIHLPVGAARIQWNESKSCFEVATVQEYGKDLNVSSVSSYVYPMNLQYQVFSDILASDELVMNEMNEDGEMTLPDEPQYENWGELLEKGYEEKGAQKSVQPTTQSVAMVKQVEYAVGRLALRARIDPYNTIYDAKDEPVDVSNGFTLKGYIVGGQREVDYDFKPVSNSRTYSIYDTDLNEGTTDVIRRVFSDGDKFNYILGLGTARDQSVCLAMELVNNCPAFQGADGVIAHGATFYLVANMVPSEGQGYTANSIDQIFIKDMATKVNLVINSLATATYGLPDLDIPHPTVGVSVDLSWGEGLWFDYVEL